jgi:hypothetical protein
MARTKKGKAPEAIDTQPPQRDAFGRLLDQWGVPVNGPCRVAALAAAGLPDPNDDPDAWEGVDAPAALSFEQQSAFFEAAEAPQVPLQDVANAGGSDDQKDVLNEGGSDDA